MISSPDNFPSCPIPPVPDDDVARVSALKRYRILDTQPEKSFDDITKLAGYICGTTIAVVTLIDRDRQWFKSKVGIEGEQTSRNNAFCAYTVYKKEVLIVEDASLDDRFKDNPMVAGEPGVRFYAGAPLITGDGFAFGSLCVVGLQPRKLSDDQLTALTALADLVVRQLELRKLSHDLSEALENVKTLGGLLPICAYCKGIRNDTGYWQSVESYINSHTEADFTHTICPNCTSKHFPDYPQAKIF